jgi:hypothetical protein
MRWSRSSSKLTGKDQRRGSKMGSSSLGLAVQLKSPEIGFFMTGQKIGLRESKVTANNFGPAGHKPT